MAAESRAISGMDAIMAITATSAENANLFRSVRYSRSRAIRSRSAGSATSMGAASS